MAGFSRPEQFARLLRKARLRSGTSRAASDRGGTALGFSEKMFRAVVSHASDAIFIIDGDSRIIFANAAASRIFGYPIEQMVGSSLQNLMPEEMRLAHRAGVRRYLETGERRISWEGIELPGLHADGRRMALEVSFGDFAAEEGHRFIGVIRDVTERRNAERERSVLALRIEKERERLRNIVSTVPGVVWEAWGEPDDANQRIDFVSDYVEQMLGYSVQEWLATPNFWLTIVHPDDRDRAAREASEAFGGSRPGLIRFRWLRRDGRAIWVESHSVVIRSPEGERIGMRGVTMDIDARKRAEDRERLLAEASTLLATSLDYEKTLALVARLAVPDLADWCAVDVATPDGQLQRIAIEHSDPARVADAEELRARLQEQGHAVASRKVIESGMPRLVTRVTDADLQRAARNREHLEALRRLDICSYMIVPLLARGRVLGTISLATAESGREYGEVDLRFAEELARRAAIAVDNSRLYGEAQAANRAKDEFLATLSHELRTPMTSILGWARMMEMGEEDPAAVRTAVSAIVRSAEAQARLIEEVLDVSRIVTGKMQLHLEPLALTSIVGEAIESVRPAAKAKGISIRVESAEVPPLNGDPARLRQIFWNLLSNAVKYTDREGEIRVRIGRNGEMVRVEVTDDGAGIDAAFLPFVFDRFRQGESSATRAYGGLGLGLAIVKHLVELHGGTVTAFSEGKERGARFVVDLPVALPAGTFETTRAEGGSIERRSVEALPRLRGSKVLVVDDEQDSRTLVASVLTRCGARVRSAGSVREALELVESFQPDAVVSDIGMPREDGFSFVEKVRRSDSQRSRPLPVIALTAYGRDEDRERIYAAGFTGLLCKPVDPAELAITIRDLIQPEVSGAEE